jgi:hypothetical protein
LAFYRKQRSDNTGRLFWEGTLGFKDKVSTPFSRTSGRMRLFLPLCTIVGLLVASASTSRAGDTNYDRDTLRGITSIPVLIEQLNPDAMSHGLSENQLQTDVELRLRKAGLTVPNAVGSGPYLYVNVWLLKGDGPIDGFFMFFYEVSLSQPAVVRANNAFAVVPTWSSSGMGIATGDRLAPYVRSNIADLVDRFINAYLSVNPKK